MENASKALLMAGGVLFTIIIISMFLFMYNNLTTYFTEESQANREAQLVKFNEEYESYNRNDENNLVRGTEILSLLAKVNQYNTDESNYEGTGAGYTPMTVKIKGIDLSNIKYDSENTENNIQKTYEQGKGNNAYYKIMELKENAKKKLKESVGKYNKKGENVSISDSDLETLSSSLGLLESTKELLDNNVEGYTVSDMGQLQKTLALIRNIFSNNYSIVYVPRYERINISNLKIINDNGSFNLEDCKKFKGWYNNYYSNIMQYTKQYYQFQQFKKSYFKCTGTKYDPHTNRIIELDFEYVKTGD